MSHRHMAFVLEFFGLCYNRLKYENRGGLDVARHNRNKPNKSD